MRSASDPRLTLLEIRLGAVWRWRQPGAGWRAVSSPFPLPGYGENTNRLTLNTCSVLCDLWRRNFPAFLKAALRSSALREIALAVPVSVGSKSMPVDDAIRAVDDLAGSPAFEDTFHNTRLPFSGEAIAVPLTVAFGDRDWILTKSSRHRNRLPAHTRWVEVRGWGHVPMWMDPIGVSQLILEGAQ